jgi:Phytanoyl-CoA dioxygenase (PhyH)/SEC-C motif
MAPMTSTLAPPGASAMEWMVAPSPEERARGQLLPEVQREAHAAFHKHGCLLLRDVFALPLIDAMHQDYVARYGNLDADGMREQSTRPPPNPIDPRGAARFEITMRMSGAFGRPEGFANPLLRSVLAPLLGGDMQLNSFSIVVSYPGARMQEIHRDHGHLFASDSEIGPSLPVYAVNVAVPLVDVDLATGPTGVWPGSHRWPSSMQARPEAVTAFPFKRGDCMLVDYRTLHTGLPNLSARVRPILYMVYARGWFCDDATHFGVDSPDMPLESYNSLPESARTPLYRAWSQAVRKERRETDRNARSGGPARNPEDPVRWGKVGRNDPCPCGSGRKYKQCHGRPA